MPERLVSLGAPAGQWCGLSHIKNPVLHVQGLEGELVAITRMPDVELKIAENGAYPLQRAAWIAVNTDGKSKKLVCTVKSAEAA